MGINDEFVVNSIDCLSVIDNRLVIVFIEYLILPYIGYFRMISNYELNVGDFILMSSILEEAGSSNLNEPLVGEVVSGIWGNKVKKTSSSNMGSGYRNLRKRSVSSEEMRDIRTLDEEMVEIIQVLPSKHDGWILDCAHEGQFTLLKVPSSQAGTTVDGRRLVYEIIATLEPPSITIRAHGQSVTLDDLEFSNCLTLNTLDSIIRLLDSTSLCMGSVVAVNNGEGDMKYLGPVASSKLVNIARSDGKGDTRLISTSCLLLTLGTRACKNCIYVAKLWRNREMKREKRPKEKLHKKCNVRYLARCGLKEKMCEQRKELRSDSAREKRAMDEMIEFTDGDCVDLRRMMENVDSNDVPADMALLWEMQRKQLASKSPSGYRWHPRYIILYNYLFTCSINKFRLLSTCKSNNFCSNIFRIVRFALDVYCKSPKALDAMREFVILPSNRLIR